LEISSSTNLNANLSYNTPLEDRYTLIVQ